MSKQGRIEYLQTTDYKRTRVEDEFELIHDDVSLIQSPMSHKKHQMDSSQYLHIDEADVVIDSF
jgi:hypothetical protein